LEKTVAAALESTIVERSGQVMVEWVDNHPPRGLKPLIFACSSIDEQTKYAIIGQAHGMACKGGRLPLEKGGTPVTVYEALMIMLTFGLLIVAILSTKRK